jgi:PAS domain S-box-containing protein
MADLAHDTSSTFRLDSEQRLQLALDAGAIAGTWYWDVRQDCFTSDARFARYFALDVEALQAGVPLAQVVQSIHPEDEPRVQRLIGRALQAGGPYAAEYRVRQLDGSYHWIEANGHVTLDAEGRAVSFPGVLIDIHARRRREILQQALIVLGDRLRDLHSVEAIAAASAHMCAETLQISRAGYGSIEGLGTHVLITADWCSGASVDSLSGLFRFEDFGDYASELRAGRVVAIEDAQRDASTPEQAAALAGIQVKGLLNVPLIQDGRLAGIVFANHRRPRPWRGDEIEFIRSVADRTWAAIAAAKAMDRMRQINADLEREIQQRSADRSLLWQISGDLMLLARFDGRLVAVNPAWRKVLGWTEQELVGSSLMDLIHPEDLQRTIDGARAIAQGTSFAVFENRYRCSDGSYRHIAWSAGPADDFMVATGRDVTEVKEHQAALLNAEDQLRQSQKMEAVGQLTGGIAHDFNNLLTIISTSVQLMRRPDPQEQRKSRLIDSIDGAVSRASKLTGQLLAFARKQSLQPVVFDAQGNIVAMTDMLQTLVGSRVSLEIVGGDGPYWVDADPGQFDTAIVNITANARDAMQRSGSIVIVLEHVPSMPAIHQHPAIVAPFVAISLTDTGSGIAPEDLLKVFEPFYTTKPVGEGTGLGLSQVFGFAKQSGGEVQVRSTMGQGTTIKLYLPAAARAHAEKSTSQPASGITEASGKVLLVEDNLDVAAVAQVALEDMGYAVHACPSGTDALAILARAPGEFAALFTDVMMAGMDGITLAREVRRLYPSLPILLASGYSSVLSNSEDRGFPLLPKPYGPAALARALREAIEGQHRV